MSDERKSDEKKANETNRPWEENLREAGKHLEEDLRRLTAYINDEIIPDVRRHGSKALRSAADELHKLAKRMEEQEKPRS